MSIFASILVLVGNTVPFNAAEFLPGLYQIGYRMEMPHLERYALPRDVTMCISEAPIPVMSGNGAFSDCEMEDVRREDARVRYTLVCEGASGARAFTDYKIFADGFTGRIFVKLGAKNMTLTEFQIGRRIGDCSEAQ